MTYCYCFGKPEREKKKKTLQQSASKLQLEEASEFLMQVHKYSNHNEMDAF